jgi:hypothetical protein
LDEGLQVKTVDDWLLLDDVAIQYTKSTDHWRYPYCLVFGQLPRIGISALPLDASVLTLLATMAQLSPVCYYIGKVNVLDNGTAVVEAIDDAEEAKTANNDKIQANTNNSENNEYVAAVDNFDDINGSGAADDNLDEIAVELLQTIIRHAKQDDIYGASNIVLPCPGG